MKAIALLPASYGLSAATTPLTPWRLHGHSEFPLAIRQLGNKLNFLVAAAPSSPTPSPHFNVVSIQHVRFCCSRFSVRPPAPHRHLNIDPGDGGWGRQGKEVKFVAGRMDFHDQMSTLILGTGGRLGKEVKFVARQMDVHIAPIHMSTLIPRIGTAGEEVKLVARRDGVWGVHCT